MFAPEAPSKVYCHDCWNSDQWEGMTYGREYDFSKPFFVQYQELRQAVPEKAISMTNCPGSRYCDGTVDCKDCYMVMGGYKSQNCMYGEPVLSRFSFDSDVVLNADHAYENVSSGNVFNTKFIYFSEDCLDSSFLFDCKGCTSCFGCINLRNKQYCIFNQQYSKKEYQEQMKYWDLGSYARLQEATKKFEALKMATPHRFAIFTNVVDCIGDDIQNSKNCKYCFMLKNGVENCKYVYLAGLLLRDSYDMTASGDNSELCYESVSTLVSSQCIAADGVSSSRNIEYARNIRNSSNLFGCISLRHKQYCILNKQYTQDEYEVLAPKIRQHMKDMPYQDAKGRIYGYGEFFPIELSLYPYNESWAFPNYPLTKEQALDAGYRWHERPPVHYTIDYHTEDLPDHIREVPDSLANAVIECQHRGGCNEICTSAFRVIPEELAFYKKMNIALPRYCPNCRYTQRFAKRNPLKLWHRKCAKCENEFETTYAPDRPEIIYCQECYNAEFL